MDPTRWDSDGDGVGDGDELLTFQVHGPAGVQVAVTGTGDMATGLHIAEVVDDARGDAPGMVGSAFEFEAAGDGDGLVQADIVLPFDPATAGADAGERLRVFWLDEQTGAWVPAGDQQVVDTQGGVVRATVEHFSTYAIFDIVNWAQTWTVKDNPCKTRTGGGGSDVVYLDLALALDSSGSMSWNDPQGLRRAAAKDFVDAFPVSLRADVVRRVDGAAKQLQDAPPPTTRSAARTVAPRVPARHRRAATGRGQARSQHSVSRPPQREQKTPSLPRCRPA